MDNRGNTGAAFMQGLIMGVIVGGVAGVLLAPKSGAETRADIMAAAEKLQKRAADLYAEAQKTVERKMKALRKAGEKIDVAAYKQMVDNVVSEMVDANKMSQAEGKKLGERMKKDSGEVVKALKA